MLQNFVTLYRKQKTYVAKYRKRGVYGCRHVNIKTYKTFKKPENLGNLKAKKLKTEKPLKTYN